jgi:solute carrier family 25 S-adenosylmethionine transporter 26
MKSLLNPLATVLPTPLLNGVASSVAELASCAILTPAEVIKQNAQMVSSTSRTNATLQTINRFRSNPSSLFNGYTALVARNLPFTALQFPLFESMRDFIHRSRKISREEISLHERVIITGLSAGTAGAFAAVITTPVDVVKTRVMLLAAEQNGSRVSELKVFKEVWRDEGMRGLWRGGALRGVWTMIGSGLYLGVYDMTRVYLGRRRGVEVEDLAYT